MTHATPLATAAAKGTSSRDRMTSADAVDHRQRPVRVRGGVAVPGEVLGAGSDPGGLQPLDPRGGVPGDQIGVGPEAAGPDDRVGRRGVHVDDRREVEVHANGGEVLPDPDRARAGELEVVEPASTALPG